ncbi:amidase domain-containing protein [Streptomyces bambusae]|uniref:amidase domain-containing protein n=1 Tax=Streptomyces bambusae TaxID=1550616 RepID=UPI001CFC908C|nr:amidase domain-containing protein [Streptomyces bambusae]MCB5166974.1 amidase domain-containing protein [Streptomyces bambusae]
MDSAAARQASTAQLALRAKRDRLIGKGLSYTRSSTVVRTKALQVDGDTATLRVVEATSFAIKKVHGDEPDHTSYQADRVFTFKREGTAWKLAGQHLAPAPGLEPMNEPAPVQPEASGPAGSALRGAATGRPSRPVGKAAGLAAGYNYGAMAAYADRYVFNYNSYYRTFSDRGGDCTNFVSQALRAGGWKDAGWPYAHTGTWWYVQSGQTPSWINVNRWADFATYSGRVYGLSNVWYQGVGDVMQMDFEGGTDKDHTMMVTYKDSGGQPYFTYHTRDTYRRPLQDILDRYTTASYWPWRT